MRRANAEYTPALGRICCRARPPKGTPKRTMSRRWIQGEPTALGRKKTEAGMQTNRDVLKRMGSQRASGAVYMKLPAGVSEPRFTFVYRNKWRSTCSKRTIRFRYCLSQLTAIESKAHVQYSRALLLSCPSVT